MLSLKQKFRKNFFLLLFIDIALFTASYAGAYLLRFDLSFPHAYYLRFRNMLVPILVVKVCVFSYFGIYRGMWRYTGLRDLANIVKASLVSFLPIILFASLTYRRY